MPKKHIDRDTIKFGQHLIFDAYGCKLSKLEDMKLCYEILNKISDIAKMKKLSEPLVIEASSNEALGGKDPGGFSGFLMIQESHISIHTFAKRGFVTIDIYSCKEFKIDKIVKYLLEVFEPKEYEIINMDRGLKYPKNNIY